MTPPVTARNGRIRLVLLLLILPLLLFLPASFTAPLRVVFLEALGPVQRVAFEASGDAAATAGTLSEMFLEQERQRALDGAVTKLRNELAEARRRLASQKQRLDSIREVRAEELSCEVLSAPVTAYDSVPLQCSVTVGAGRTDGVREGQAVCALGALVGRVQQAGPWRSRVRLITDPGSQITCRVGASRTVCVLQGTGGKKLKLDWVDRHTQVKPDDPVVTARLEHVGDGPPRMPAGLPVATVVSVEHGRKNPLILAVEAEPLVPTDRLEWVEVLVPRGGRERQ